MGAQANVELNSGVHTTFHANAYEVGPDGPNNRSLVECDWWAERRSSSAHYDNPGVTCQPTIGGWGTLGATNYSITPAGTVGTTFPSLNTSAQAYIGHNADGTGASSTYLYAAIPSAGSGADGAYGWALTPIGPAAPATPTVSNLGATTAHVAWARGSGYSDPSSYTLQWSTDSFATVAGSVGAGTATSYDVTGLTPGTKYKFRVVAANASGSATSAASTEAMTLAGRSKKVAGAYVHTVLYKKVGGVYKIVLHFKKVGGTYKVVS